MGFFNGCHLMEAGHGTGWDHLGGREALGAAMSTAKSFAPARKAQKPASGAAASPSSKVRPFAEAGARLGNGVQRDLLGEYVQRRVAAEQGKGGAGSGRKVYVPARTARPADPGTAVPSLQLNRVYKAGADGAKGALEETDSFDFEPPDWCQFIYESELVFVKSEDVGAFQNDFPEAVLVPQDDLDEDDEKSIQQNEQDVVPDRHPQELPLKVVGDPDEDARISRIILRGSRIASQHQELMCVLANRGGDHCLRFSRNMTNDTAQWNATLSFQSLPELESHQVDISAKEALAAFHAAHDSIQAYEQGDCQAFAAEILNELGLGD